MKTCGNEMGGGMGKSGNRTVKKIKPIGKNNQNKRTKVKLKKINDN